MVSDRTKVSSVVHSAMMRDWRATTSGLPPMARITRAPTRGRKVMIESSGECVRKLPMVLSPPLTRPSDDEPGHDHGDAGDHGEGVVVEVARLHRAEAAGSIGGQRREAVGPETVDGAGVAFFP